MQLTVKFRFLVSFILIAIWGLTACGSAETTPVDNDSSATQAEATATATVAPATAMPTEPSATATTASQESANDSAAAADAPDVAGNPDLDYAQVQFVRATPSGENSWRFDVSVRHNDQGWDHYADLWRVVDLEGNVLGERVLAHPHDNEQPFTRSQRGIEIPPEITQVIVEAKCNVHGFGGQAVLVQLNQAEGENFEVVQ